MNIKKAFITTLGTAAILGAGIFAGTTSANADVRVTVKSGDTVAKIANQYNSSISAIEKANNLKNVNLIYVGESLEIPNATSASTTSTTSATTTPSQSTTTTNNTNTYNAANTTSNYSQQSSNTASTGTTSSASTATSTSTSDSSSAKAWIANKESGGSYTASNGNYYGKYQLSKSYLNGDYSAANQEKVADAYVSSRYGSWAAAKAFWQANGWY
ncbi:MAG: LysM peptidoglycan-binding domain-containing protein [Levilactobacillus sp.]|jgi:murein DD-endopeptidase MepM/ murein hydrolase activator NlpD|uniref:aggregation-promoting factor n=1 Tax=Levilactobacillus sp. TaxID=2767919 RepID=UPI0025845389|nr:LysM peptidoglycan-binding domain-containing protein [Levilactobacillus sp.]MCI1552881.1 LysM peptidoglycan-binding domain-containing protein [Levilactobacillus sp.]MCI1598021.1 LysM peptidoglycan-binding domain-containing protein [Levilactobacillus sp.]MCI1605699.1 LysM peptidoglycan-binding domain-containing protein [Levilactobacillus sp.]